MGYPNAWKRSARRAWTPVVCLGLAAAPAAAVAAAIEEVIVTAQRTEESLQDVPIAVTALSGTQMEDRQIVTFSDLQLNAPNVSFTSTNFGGSSMSIRGIGRLVISGSGENGVSQHINEVAVTSNLNAVEFYDVERVEVLRGPQGTLFGRNATGGAVNMVTRMPTFDETGGFIDGELGDYEHRRLKGAFNLPLTDNFALRFAGMLLERDGYIENVAFEQPSQTDGSLLPRIDDDLDGRDLHSYRITANWLPTERSEAWLIYSKFDEDDDRARITNQICVRNDQPTTGCVPDEFGFEGVHPGATTGGVLGGLALAIPAGAAEEPFLNYDYPRPENLGFRSMHTDFDPVYQYDEDLWLAGFNYDFDNFSAGIIGGYQETDYLQQQDYNMDVGFSLNPTSRNPSGYYPTSAPAGGPSGDWTSDQCNYQDGTSGVFGGCILDVDTTRSFAYDQASSETEYWVVEAKVNSSFDGPVNFLVGASTYQTEDNGDYYVLANTLDLYSLYGLEGVGAPPAYPGFFNSTGDPGATNEGDGYAVFGEVYFDVNERLKLTAGLRYNEDNKEVADTVPLFDSFDINFLTRTDVADAASGALGPDPVWVRSDLIGWVTGGAPLDADQQALVDYWDATDAFAAAGGTTPFSAERIAASQLVGPVPDFNERRVLTDSPTDVEFTDVTGRLGFDYIVNDTTMVYGYFSRGYKPGGFNPPVSPVFGDDVPLTYDEEQIDAFEVGVKSDLLDGQVRLNASAFVYDYEGLQITRIINNSSVNQNIDADIWGMELEGQWSPAALPGLAVDFAYSYLDTEVAGASSIDPANKTAGDPDWTLLKNIDSGPLSGVLYIAPTDAALAATPTLLGLGAALSPQNGTAVPGTDYPNGIPSYVSRQALDAVCGACTQDGIEVDLDGNQLPSSPEHTIKIGLAYTFQTNIGLFTPRWDYYWQDDMYGREFNTRGDAIDSWDQHNISLIYESMNGNWMVKAWGRNLQDDDNITGHYLTSDTSGLYRNYFLTEPRVYGLTVRYGFGSR